jgi:hypothetical protein
MYLAMIIAKMAKGRFSCTATEETQYLIKRPRAEVSDEQMRGVEFPGHKHVKAAMGRHLAMIH